MQRLVIWFIEQYQHWISPFISRGRCRFLPTCSEYTKEAVARFGVSQGLRLGLGRILRCWPLYKGDWYDPVPYEIREK